MAGECKYFAFITCTHADERWSRWHLIGFMRSNVGYPWVTSLDVV